MQDLLTPKQVARAIGASEASLKRWCDKGVIASVRTVGGHRRLPVGGVMQFLRESGYVLARPEVLGLPATAGEGRHTIDEARTHVRTALEAGDEKRCAQIVFDLYLSGRSACEICDLAIAPAFHEIGARWRHGQIEVYEERRGCEVAARALHQLRRVLPPPAESAPLAIGGTLEGDPYTLPTLMAEIGLTEAGWRAGSYGTGLPASTLAAAVRAVRPRLLWLSVSAIPSPAEFLAGCEKLFETATGAGCPVIVGGRALGDDLRRQMRYTAHGDNLQHLRAFAQSIYSS